MLRIMIGTRWKRAALGGTATTLLAMCCLAADAQDVPLLSGGVGFLTDTNGGNTTYVPTISPVFAMPLTDRVLVESKANLLEIVFPRPHVGYDTQRFLGLTYLQADVQVAPQATVVGGYFYTPFNTFVERLSPIWINNFEDAPIISGVGVAGGSSLGGMLRGNAFQNGNVAVSYAGYYSTKSANSQFSSSRTSGGRVGLLFPKHDVELTASMNWQLRSKRTHDVGASLWWTPAGSPFRFRSEYAHAPHSQGYWAEFDYRLSRFGGEDSVVGRLEPIFRMQQTFRGLRDSTDTLPANSTQRADFGLDYWLPHQVRINTSYARQFSAAGNENIWETSLVYRFLFPVWRQKQ